MTERFNPRPGDLQPCEVGPLASHLAGFAALIRAQGYCTENWLDEDPVGSRFKQVDEGKACCAKATRRKAGSHVSQNSLEASSS